MFKISYIVDDKRLPDMLRSCSGLVYNLEVIPVPNTDHNPKANLSKPKLLTPPSATPQRHGPTPTDRNFIADLGWEKGRQFRGADVHKRCRSIGLKESSHWYVITHELKAGRIKKVSAGLYEVVG